MEYILRKTTINTMELRGEIDEEGKTTEQLRDEMETRGPMHGWKLPTISKQTVLIELDEQAYGGSHLVGKWNE